jgi:hypothetical protein
MFPDIKDFPLMASYHKNKKVSLGEILYKGLQEFTYHYISGISHYKDSNSRIDSKRDMPTLSMNPTLHLLRYVIRSVSIFKSHDVSDVGPDDFIIPGTFNSQSRGFEFFITRTTNKFNVINEQGDDEVKIHKIPLADLGVSLCILDGIWRTPPMKFMNTYFEIYTHDDPVSVVSSRNPKQCRICRFLTIPRSIKMLLLKLLK